MMKLAPIFTDHMVLQREKPLHLWGTGETDTLVTVTLGSVTGTAAVRDGNWALTLPPLPAGGPYMLTCSDGTHTVTLSDVMLGEVWLCGGQSNMELALMNSKDPQEALDTCAASGVRLYHVGKRGFFDAQFYAEEAASCWQLPTADACKWWTAVGYYFGAMLAKKCGVTVGLVECNYGGTSASAWMSREMLSGTSAGQLYLEDYIRDTEGLTDAQACQKYLDYCEYHNAWQKRIDECYRENPGIAWKDALEICGENRYPGPQAPNNPLRPHGLYDTMLSRITPYTLRGVLYYQGESDDHRPESYQTLLSCLIRQWREDFRDAELPFLLAQLPMFSYEGEQLRTNWAVIRQAQEQVYRTTKNVGLACFPEYGEYNEIHPREKKIPAERLYLQALREVYHWQETGTTAPLVRTAYPAGNGICVIFDNVDKGLLLRGTEGFSLCGTDGTWHPAKASANGNRLLVTSPDVPHPAGVRYAWYNFGAVTLFEQNGLPAAPFQIYV